MPDTFIHLFNKILKKEETTNIVIDLGGSYLKAIYKGENNNYKLFTEKNRGNPATAICDWLEKEKLLHKPASLGKNQKAG